jgi:predicted ATPase/class 3 adenylate cyclase
MRCPACQAQNPPGAPYCVQCAAELGRLCPACGFLNPLNHRFCGQCGTRLEGDAPAPTSIPPAQSSVRGSGGGEGEAYPPPDQRRDVTILIADLSNYTATIHDLDPEDAYSLVADYLTILGRTVLEYGGTVHKYTGDGVIALFGAPEAHEDDPERALRAALAMQEGVASYRPRLSNGVTGVLRMRIGVHMGTVILGALGPDGAQEYTVVGEAVNLAARLEQAAEPGTILVSAPVVQRTWPLFTFEPQPPLRVKGLPEAVEAYRLLGPRLQPGRVRGVPGLYAPIIGRDQQLKQLQTTLTRLIRDKRGQVVLISGEAGVGKTRLVSELHALVTGDRNQAEALPEDGRGWREGVLWLEGRCTDIKRTQAYTPFVQALSTALGLSTADSEEERLAKIEAALERSGGAAGQALLPYFTFLLSAGPSSGALPENISHLGPLAVQQQTFIAVRQFLQWEAARQPVVLLLDDLHWADELSRELLISLLDLSERLPVLFLCISRDEDESGTLALIRRAAQMRVPEHITSMVLEPLSDEDCGRLIDHLLSNPALPSVLRQGIISRARGNPFFVEEILRMLIDRGQLVRSPVPGFSPVRADVAWVLAPGAAETVDGVPGTISALILARFDRLAQPLQATLQAAAVLGGPFTYAELNAMGRLPEPELRRHLNELVAREFLIKAQATPDEETYAFKHPLTQEAIYSTLLRRQRRQLHRAAGEALERLYTGRLETQAESLARHFEECEQPEKAGPYLLLAAERAAAHYANEQAIAYFERARKALEAVGSGRWAVDKVGLPADPARLAQRIATGLGSVHKFVGRLAEALHEFYEALKLAQAAPDSQADVADLMVRIAATHERLGKFREAIAWYQRAHEVVSAEPRPNRAIRAQITCGIGEAYFDLGQYDLARRHVRHSLGLVAGTGHYAEQAKAYNFLGGICFQTGDRAGALHYTRLALALREAMGYTADIANSSSNLAILLWIQGQRDEALRLLERAIRLSEDIGDADRLRSALTNLGLCYFRLGQLDRAHDYLQRGLALARRMNDIPGIIIIQLNLTQVYLERSELAQAEAALAEALRLAEGISSQAQLAEAHELRARLYLARNDTATALIEGQRALEIALDIHSVEHQANVYRTLAAAHRIRGEWAEAEAELEQSLAACGQVDDPYLLALTLYEQGRLFLDRARAGDGEVATWRAQARAKLEAARDLFARQEAARPLHQVQALLRELDGGRRMEDEEMAWAVTRRSPFAEHRWREAAVLAVRLTFSAGSGPAESAHDDELFQQALPMLLDAAARFGGTAQTLPNGFNLVFGAPVAQEDAAERALRAGLALHTALEEINQRLAQGRLALVQAVAGGPVIVDDQLVIGASLQAAERLVQIAAPGHILVTPSIRQATVRLFDFEPLPHDGSSGDECPYRLIRATLSRRGLRLATGQPAPLVGRDAEAAALRQIMTLTVETGVGHVVLVQGEAGIGKSRLVNDVLRGHGRRTVDQGSPFTPPSFKVVTAHAYAHTQGIAYAALTELVQDLLDITPNTPTYEVRARLDAHLPPDAPEAIREGLLHLLGQLTAGASGWLERLDAAQIRQQMFIALRTLLLTEAAKQPLAIIFEDAHWLDPASIDALFFLLGVIKQAPLLVCCLMRTEEPGPHNRIPTVAARMCPGRVLHLMLQPLPAQHIEQLLHHLIGDGREALPGVDEVAEGRSGAGFNPPLSAALRQRIIARAEGNPLFLEEMVMLLAAGERASLAVPRSISALVLSRLDRLPASQQHLAEAAAVLGLPFDAYLLEQMLGEEVSAADLAALCEHGLIVPTDLPGRYRFRHGLMQEAVYESLSKRRRARWHRLAGEVLERLAGDQVERYAEALAHHFVQADLPERALPYLLIAGRRAADSYANEAAAATFAQAKALLERIPNVSAADRWAIHIGLSDALAATGDHRGALAELETLRTSGLTEAVAPHLRAGLHRRLAKSAERSGEMERALAELALARASLGPANEEEGDASRLERAQIELTLGWMLFRQGHTEAAQTAALAALQAAEELADLNAIAAACNLLGGLAYTTGDLAQAVALSERSLALRREIGDPAGMAAAYSNLGVLAVAQGQWDQAIEHFERALAMRREAGDLAGEAIVLSNLGQIMKDRGDFTQAVAYFTASLHAAERAESVYQQVVNRSNLGHLKALQGDGEGAVQALSESIRQARAIGAQELVAEAHWMLAEAQLVRGDVPAAEAAAQHALELAGEIDHWRHAAHARRMLGRAALRSGECLKAARQLRAALRIARRLGDKLVLAMVYDEWADLRARSTRPERAWYWRQRAQQLYGGLKL